MSRPSADLRQSIHPANAALATTAASRRAGSAAQPRALSHV